MIVLPAHFIYASLPNGQIEGRSTPLAVFANLQFSPALFLS